VTLEEAELAWLAGIAAPSRGVRDIAASVLQADPENMATERIERPGLLQNFHAELREKAPSRVSISAATGLTDIAVQYLHANESFHPWGPREAGTKGVENLDRLRHEIGLKRLAPS
jgi:hypothetical protein